MRTGAHSIVGRELVTACGARVPALEPVEDAALVIEMPAPTIQHKRTMCFQGMRNWRAIESEVARHAAGAGFEWHFFEANRTPASGAFFIQTVTRRTDDQKQEGIVLGLAVVGLVLSAVLAFMQGQI